MRILGIDPGVATIGLGLVEASSPYDMRAVEWLTIETASSIPFPQRLQEIRRDLAEFLADAKPELCVIERLFFETNVKTALDVAHARGVLVLTAAEAGLPIREPTPLQLKLAITGDGKADKRQMQEMVVRLLHLKEIPKPDDAADALALAIYGALERTHAAIGA